MASLRATEVYDHLQYPWRGSPDVCGSLIAIRSLSFDWIRSLSLYYTCRASSCCTISCKTCSSDIQLARLVSTRTCLGQDERRVSRTLPTTHYGMSVSFTLLCKSHVTQYLCSSGSLTCLHGMDKRECAESCIVSSHLDITIQEVMHWSLLRGTWKRQTRSILPEYGLMWRRQCRACRCLVNEMQCIAQASKRGTKVDMKSNTKFRTLRNIHTCCPKSRTCHDFM